MQHSWCKSCTKQRKQCIPTCVLLLHLLCIQAVMTLCFAYWALSTVPRQKTSKLINNIWEKRAEMPLCPHSVALVHSGEGHWKKENEFETESGDEKREGRVRDGAGESAGNRFSRAQAGSPGSLCRPLFTHREISHNFTAPLSAAIEKGQIPSWLLTLCPVRVVAIMGKSKPLASTVGYLSSPAPQPQCKQQPRVMSVKSVCAWGLGAHCWD